MNVKKNRERECWGSKGQRVGEGEKGEGRGADTRRADFSQISLHLCDKKGNNSFRWGNLQRDTFHLPLHCVRQITGNTEEKEREASLARMWADVLKCTQHRLFQMYKIRLNINTFILEEKKLKFIPTLVLTFWINFIYHCNNSAGACFDDTDAETNWQEAFWHTCYRANTARGCGGVQENLSVTASSRAWSLLSSCVLTRTIPVGLHVLACCLAASPSLRFYPIEFQYFAKVLGMFDSLILSQFTFLAAIIWPSKHHLENSIIYTIT